MQHSCHTFYTVSNRMTVIQYPAEAGFPFILFHNSFLDPQRSFKDPLYIHGTAFCLAADFLDIFKEPGICYHPCFYYLR